MVAFDPASVLFLGMDFVEEKMVNESDTAAHYGSHQLGHLIASPAYVGLMINASVKAVEHRLPEGYVTVGHAMEFTHDQPTSLGMHLRIKATLKEIRGEKLLFEIVACDDYGIIGHGRHERVIVNKAKLFEKANQRLLKKAI